MMFELPLGTPEAASSPSWMSHSPTASPFWLVIELGHVYRNPSSTGDPKPDAVSRWCLMNLDKGDRPFSLLVIRAVSHSHQLVQFCLMLLPRCMTGHCSACRSQSCPLELPQSYALVLLCISARSLLSQCRASMLMNSHRSIYHFLLIFQLPLQSRMPLECTECSSPQLNSNLALVSSIFSSESLTEM